MKKADFKSEVIFKYKGEMYKYYPSSEDSCSGHISKGFMGHKSKAFHETGYLCNVSLVGKGYIHIFAFVFDKHIKMKLSMKDMVQF